MLTKAELPIPNPCGFDFAKMTRAEANRRFCASCRKHVHDLTLLTEAEARALIASPRTAELCVRYVADAKGRVVFVPDVPATRLTYRKRTVLAAAALAAAAAASGCATSPPMMGDIPGPQVEPKNAYEVSRGATRISFQDAGGTFKDASVADNAPGCERYNPHVRGACSGDAESCQQVRTLLETASSANDFVARLQLAGFSIVQQTRLLP